MKRNNIRKFIRRTFVIFGLIILLVFFLAPESWQSAITTIIRIYAFTVFGYILVFDLIPLIWEWIKSLMNSGNN